MQRQAIGMMQQMMGVQQQMIAAQLECGKLQLEEMKLNLAANVAKYLGDPNHKGESVLIDKGESETDRLLPQSLRSKLLAEDADCKIILFIDELHTLVGAGKGEGSMDAANLLKPMLARGELHCLGATTLDEYRQYIEKDPALARRFQPVYVEEPTVDDTISILRGLKEKYEGHHGVRIADAALVSAVKLSNRYITDRFLPDKAIDLIDEAAARVRIEVSSKPDKLDEVDRHLMQLKIEQQALKKEKDDESKKRLADLEKIIKTTEEESRVLTEQWRAEQQKMRGLSDAMAALDAAKAEVATAMRNGDYEKASALQYGKIPELEEKIAKMNELEVFDNYVVLYYDPDGKVYKETAYEEAKRRDPIIFGVIAGSKKLYYVADWIDEYCDLTLDAFVDALGIEKDDLHFDAEEIKKAKLEKEEKPKNKKRKRK